jgi:hypothetical protein
MYVQSVEKTGDRKEAAQKELPLHRSETSWRSKADWARWDMKCGCEQKIHASMYRLCTLCICVCTWIYHVQMEIVVLEGI